MKTRSTSETEGLCSASRMIAGKMGAIVLAGALSACCLAACGGGDKSSSSEPAASSTPAASAPADSQADATPTGEKTHKGDGAEFIDQSKLPYCSADGKIVVDSDADVAKIAGTFTFDGKTVKLPCTAKELVKQIGWTMKYSKEQDEDRYGKDGIIEPGKEVSMFDAAFKDFDGDGYGKDEFGKNDTEQKASIGLWVVNTSDKKTKWTDCVVARVNISADDFENYDPGFSTSDGATLGMAKQDVFAIYGPGNKSLSEAQSAKTDTYFFEQRDKMDNKRFESGYAGLYFSYDDSFNVKRVSLQYMGKYQKKVFYGQ